MPFQVIVDDSGCKGQGPHLVLAGLIGPAEHWAEFSDRWAERLSDAPGIRYFKMQEAANRTGQFSRFSKKARDEKLIALVEAMNIHPFSALHVTLDLVEHEAMFEPWTRKASAPRGAKRRKPIPKSEAILGNSCLYATDSFMALACYHLWDRGVREAFEFIVDEHPSLGGPTRRWYPVLRELVKEPMKSILPLAPISRDDLKFLPLQAADMIAWFQRRQNDTGHDYHWLGKYFSRVTPSDRCVHIGGPFFEYLRRRQADPDREPLPLEAQIQIARLQGAPIPALGEPWPKKTSPK